MPWPGQHGTVSKVPEAVPISVVVQDGEGGVIGVIVGEPPLLRLSYDVLCSGVSAPGGGNIIVVVGELGVVSIPAVTFWHRFGQGAQHGPLIEDESLVTGRSLGCLSIQAHVELGAVVSVWERGVGDGLAIPVEVGSRGTREHAVLRDLWFINTAGPLGDVRPVAAALCAVEVEPRGAVRLSVDGIHALVVDVADRGVWVLEGTIPAGAQLVGERGLLQFLPIAAVDDVRRVAGVGVPCLPQIEYQPIGAVDLLGYAIVAFPVGIAESGILEHAVPLRALRQIDAIELDLRGQRFLRGLAVGVEQELPIGGGDHAEQRQ